MTLRHALLTILLVGAVFPTVSCGPREPGPPNLLLLSVDTLRPDHLGYGGAARPTSPAIDALARDGVVFARAWSQSGWTLPSMATILTGRYPKDHGAIDFNHGIDRQLPTLATLLAARGYDTRAYVSHVLLTEKYGFDRGFVKFDASVLAGSDPHKVATSEKLVALASQDLETLRPPFFAWVHFFDPHFAYLPHEEWSSFGDGEIDRYDQEIAYTDRAIGRLLAAMEAHGLLENTVIVFTADHGEEFGEHGGQYHETCYDEVLRVPLVIRAPGVAPAVVDAPVEQLDLFPTLLRRVGAPVPAECAGRDLLDEGTRPSHPIFVERDHPPGFRQRAVVTRGRKLIRVEEREAAFLDEGSRTVYSEATNVVAGTYLYDLENDPGEQTNLFQPDDLVSQRMLGHLMTYGTARTVAPAESVVVDAEMIEKLRALGYIN